MLKAGQTLLLISETAANVATWMNLVTRLRYHSDTFFISTTLFESGFVSVVSSFDFFGAKATFACVLIVLCLFAGHTYVVRLAFATSTKVFGTIAASDSVLGHVLS